MLLYVYVFDMCVNACEGQKRGIRFPLGLELQLVVTHQTLVLGTTLEFKPLGNLFSPSTDF